MAVLFVSHSSKDDAATTALEVWLVANGFTDTFIDHHSIAGGDAWGEALQAVAGTAGGGVLVTENWLASYECFGEFQASFYMGKRLIRCSCLRKGRAVATKPRSGSRRCVRIIRVLTCTLLGPDGALDLSADRNVADRLMAGLREAGALSRVGLDPKLRDRPKLRPMPFPALPRSVMTMPTPRCSMAAVAKSLRYWKRCERCVPPLSGSRL